MLNQFLKTVADPSRNLAIDYCRAAAIVSVVLYHFDWLPFGFMGVDLFFVISGFLVSRPLLESYERREPIRIKDFLIRRAFKIWPSYFFFLAAGSVLAWIMYGASRPEQIITLKHLPRYLFFFLNYRGLDHWSFDHLWSICVEEHFYVLLPAGFLGLAAFCAKTRPLIAALIACIVAGNLLRVLSYEIGFETVSATHNRIDALAWGVLLSLLHRNGATLLRSRRASTAIALAGGVLLAGTLYFHEAGGEFFRKVAFFGIVPFGFFTVIFGLLNLPIPSSLAPRFLAYFSFNWYLWHPLPVHFIRDNLGGGTFALLAYLFSTLSLAVLITLTIEEPALSLRNQISKPGM